ncbi:hypothetical protein [Rhizobium leguminosarum]|uniref:hypothetical protein n=1 Tax=Rhizobium leguminosarum TaxID=384 RepID=UPI002E0FBDAD|nr:hypothetical protein U8Q02_38515 [Rhizobium leguminosarum]
MAQEMRAKIAGQNVTWTMSGRYDMPGTAFIWVENERPISGLMLGIVKSRAHGWLPPPGTLYGPKKLFVIKPVQMDILPDWCRGRLIHEARRDDTHTWMEIERGTAKDTRLKKIYKPVALTQDSSGWRLDYEDDIPGATSLANVISNFRGYGLLPAARAVKDVAEAPSA